MALILLDLLGFCLATEKKDTSQLANCQLLSKKTSNKGWVIGEKEGVEFQSLPPLSSSQD